MKTKLLLVFLILVFGGSIHSNAMENQEELQSQNDTDLNYLNSNIGKEIKLLITRLDGEEAPTKVLACTYLGWYVYSEAECQSNCDAMYPGTTAVAFPWYSGPEYDCYCCDF